MTLFASTESCLQQKPRPPSPSPPPTPTLDDLLDDYDLKELQELTEDAPNAESERLIAQYCRQRTADVKREQRRARYGRVYPIRREDYRREVTEASNVHDDEEDVFFTKTDWLGVIGPFNIFVPLQSDTQMRSAVTTSNARNQKNVRSSGRKTGDSDSEFEFDI